jgi:hypothetical protein
MPHWPLRELGYAVVFIVTALLLYVVGYAMMLERSESESNLFDQRLHPRYRSGGETAQAVFGPVQSVDEKLFPDRWVNERAVRLIESLRRLKNGSSLPPDKETD